MKAHLLFRDRDPNPAAAPCFNKEDLRADLALDRVVEAMARGDETIAEACSGALYRPLEDAEEIGYRQAILRDALRNPEAVRALYAVTVETFRQKRQAWHFLSMSRSLTGTLSDATDLLRIYTKMLMALRGVADRHLADFQSEGFVVLLTMLKRELDDAYFEQIQEHLRALSRGDGLLISATLGNWNQGVNYVLREKARRGFSLRWRFAQRFTLSARDDAGAADFGNRRDRAVNEVANALAQAAEHIEHFFAMLQKELAFYVGCVNLSDALRALGMPLSIPDVAPRAQADRAWDNLYDVGLALTKKAPVVGNAFSAEDKQLYLVTGPNQGGKTTFLRSVGQAQLMAQCGMPVAAARFEAPVCNGVFTHFKREEDAAMKSGKLDEELTRMDALADHLHKGALVLFNESFAATNAREGSEICRQITQALIESGVEVFSVTHLYPFAAAFKGRPEVQFLQAQRLSGGARTYKIVPGEPLQTAYGEDLYRQIFGEDAPHAGSGPVPNGAPSDLL